MTQPKAPETAAAAAVIDRANIPRGVYVKVRGRQFELRANAGTNPATGKSQPLYDRVPLDTPARELGEAALALANRAATLKVTRRRRRNGEVTLAEPAPAPGRRSERLTRHALETWWKAYGSKLDDAGTIRDYIDSYLLPGLGDVAIWRLRPVLDVMDSPTQVDLFDLTEFFDRLAESGRVGRPDGDGGRTGQGGALMASTLHKAHGILRRALTLEVRLHPGLLAANPAVGVKLPKVKKGASTTPTPEELAEFLPFLGGEGRMRAAYQVTRWHPPSAKKVTYLVPAKVDHAAAEIRRPVRVFAMLVAAGPRPGEAAALTRDHYDRATGRLSLRAESLVRHREKGKPEYWEIERGETEKRRKRTITLAPSVRAALDELLTAQDAKALAAGVTLGRRSYLFSYELDCSEPATPAALSNTFERTVKAAIRAGIDLPPGMHLYDMRHYGITQLLSKGRNPRTVAERFGTSEDMIRRVYNDSIPGDDDRLAETEEEMWTTVLRPAAGEVIPLRRE